MKVSGLLQMIVPGLPGRGQDRWGRPRTVLVTGGAGYIGSALLPKLLERGYRVRVLDALLYGIEPIQRLVGNPLLEIAHADFRRLDQVIAAMRRVDAVVHLGAIVGDPACALDRDVTVEVNLQATRTIAEVAKAARVGRFVFASTCSVYGASDGILDERSELNPVSLYAQSKIAAERVVRGLADERFTPVVLRFGTVFGLSGRIRFDLVVNRLTATGLVDRQISVFGGDQWRPFVHVDDVARAVLLALEAPPVVVHDQVFNVGSNDQNHTIQQVGELVHRHLPSATFRTGGADGDRRNYRVCFDKISGILGFAPRWTVEQGIVQVMHAIQSGRVRDYRDRRYSNVDYLRDLLARQILRRQDAWADELLDQIPMNQPRRAPALAPMVAPIVAPSPQAG